jgi:type IV pilus assembly protein PilB
MGDLVKPGSIGFILLKSQIVTETDISAALEEQRKSGCRIGEALVRLGIVTQEDIDWALSNQLNIPYVRLKREMIDRAAVDLLPGYICRQYGIMPIICYGNELSVAMIDPLNSEAIAAVQELTGLTVAVSVALIRELREMHAIFYDTVAEGDTLDFSSPLFPVEALARINVDLSGTKLTDYILSYMVQQNLASLSFQPLDDRCRVLARKKGETREIGSFPLNRYNPIQQRLRRLAGVGAEANGERGRIAFSFKGAELCVEANFLRMTGGDSITLRRRLTVPFPDSMEKFLTTDRERALLRSVFVQARGVILCTAGEQEDLDRLIDFCLDGVTGQGKSAVLIGDRIGRSGCNYPRVDCTGITSAGFSVLLNALLEHEPEVIAIEDVSREHLLLGAGKAALRGKLLVGGLPGFDPASIFTTLGHLWRHHHFVPDTVKGIINCRAVHLLCSGCRQSYSPSGEELAAMGLVNPPQQFYSASGCKECGQSGYSSRKHLLEIIAMTPELLQAMERSIDGREVVQFLNSRGLTGVRAQGVALLDAGEISPQEFISALVL